MTLNQSRLTDRLDYFKNTEPFDQLNGELYTEQFKEGTHKIELSFDSPVNGNELRLFCNGTATVILEREENGMWIPVDNAKISAGENEVLMTALKGSLKGKRFRLRLNVPADTVLTIAELDFWGIPVK